jgi:predicted ABC-type exoprotein transport system permease subunit
VVVKKIAAISLISILLAFVISVSNFLVAARMFFLLFAETEIAPLMPRHCNLPSLLFRFKLIAYPNSHPSSRKLGLIAG